MAATGPQSLGGSEAERSPRLARSSYLGESRGLGSETAFPYGP